MIRTRPSARVTVDAATILHIMDGSAIVETADGEFAVDAGSVFAVGRRRWWRIAPHCHVRVWALYAEEEFLRTQMRWFLPERAHVPPGVHPDDWDGRSQLFVAERALLDGLEPIWRQLDGLRHSPLSPEAIAARSVELFARSISLALPVFVLTDLAPAQAEPGAQVVLPTSGARVPRAAGQAMLLLRERMSEPWTASSLAGAVALSRSHLTRLFTRHYGASPMRLLAELRVTEFTRLIEETDLTIAAAASRVGWSDPRVGSTWFRRRFGILPSQARGTQGSRHH